MVESQPIDRPRQLLGRLKGVARDEALLRLMDRIIEAPKDSGLAESFLYSISKHLKGIEEDVEKQERANFQRQQFVAQWQNFWEDLGVPCDLFRLKVLVKPKDLPLCLVIPQGITHNQVFDLCKQHFPCYCYAEDIDAIVRNPDRSPLKVSYAIMVRRARAARGNWWQKDSETLIERLVRELFVVKKTGQHPSPGGVSLCHGCRIGSNWPRVVWFHEKLIVDWDDWGCRHPEGPRNAQEIFSPVLPA